MTIIGTSPFPLAAAPAPPLADLSGTMQKTTLHFQTREITTRERTTFGASLSLTKGINTSIVEITNLIAPLLPIDLINLRAPTIPLIHLVPPSNFRQATAPLLDASLRPPIQLHPLDLECLKLLPSSVGKVRGANDHLALTMKAKLRPSDFRLHFT